MRHPVRGTTSAVILFAAVTAVAVAGPWLAPHGPNTQLDPIAMASLPPSLAHPFGTDTFSRDVLSRVLHGGRLSLGIAALAVTVALSLGTLVGSVAARLGGIADTLLMRLTDAALAFPRILVLLLLVAASGPLDALTFALLIGATGWMTTARLVRQETQRLLATEHLRGARVLGVPWPSLLRRHLLPGLLPTLAAAGTIAFAAAVPLEAGLSFLGLGVRPPQASWGNIITGAESQVVRHWWMVLFPTLCIVVTVFAANVIAERISTDRRARQ
ncbi:MAG TPA: ABC transporter permease [Gemmatimonadaceae bacterium]|nr:ABC transporter permease [Gemmatimonadaceae bacterium]